MKGWRQNSMITLYVSLGSSVKKLRSVTFEKSQKVTR
jgi:hypothetical protein